jgi:hypothetical protein
MWSDPIWKTTECQNHFITALKQLKSDKSVIEDVLLSAFIDYLIEYL